MRIFFLDHIINEGIPYKDLVII